MGTAVASKPPKAASRALVRAYLLAKQRVIDAGFEAEIAWQEYVSPDRVTPRGFVREAAWVVLCAGMREAIVRSRFERLEAAFWAWNPQRISDGRSTCLRKASPVFNHAPKLNAIVRIAVEVASHGVEPYLRGMSQSGPTFLTQLPYIGRVTCFHLAKNLGCPVAKPDRHLERMAATLGYPSPSHLCGVIADALDEPIQVVDIVMWRFATIERRYESWLTQTAAWTPQPQDRSWSPAASPS